MEVAKPHSSWCSKLQMCAEQNWRRLRSYQLINKVTKEVIYTDVFEREKEAKEEAE